MIRDRDDIDHYIDAWNAHDADLVLPYFVDDCVYESVATGITNSGKDQLRRYLERAFTTIDDLHVYVAKAHMDAGWMVTEWVMTGRPHPGREPPAAVDGQLCVRGASIGELDTHGHIVRITDYWNPADLERTSAIS